MAGNGRYDITSSSPDSGSVGLRGNGFGPSLDRSGSFRAGGESRSFGVGPPNPRVNGIMIGNVPPLSQCLMLDPIVLADQKNTRPCELNRALGSSAGSSSEENSFGARSPPAAAFEELKRYKDGVTDVNNKARFRAKKLDDHLHKLNKYVEVVNSKKQPRNGLSSNERSSTLNLKMGVQIQQNLAEVVPELEDRAKTTPINKRVRTSMAEARAESRNNGVARQSLLMAKDRDLPKDKSPSSDLAEEKVRKLPAGGEGWDKKIKRKRSVGTSLTKPLDSEVELKLSTQQKIIIESGSQSGDPQGFRSGHANSISGSNKLDSSSLPGNALLRATQKNEPGKATLTRDLPVGQTKGKPLAKGCNGSTVREDNPSPILSPITKVKAPRAPRSNSGAASNSSLSIPRVPENWEQPITVNKKNPVAMTNIRKRAFPTGSSSPPMAQWVGQRPHKMSRTRRANLVSPVSIHEEGNVTQEGCSPSDLCTNISSGGTSGSFMSKGMSNGFQQLKVKCENVSSPAQFSGGEESGACESGLKDKVGASEPVDEKAVSSAQESVPALFITKKNKPLTKEGKGDGVRRKGRSGRGSFPLATSSPTGEKLDNGVTMKPVRTKRAGGEKSGSRAGRPVKKQIDRKGSSRRGPASASPDFTGFTVRTPVESDDDHEEFMAAAVSARNASNQACTNSFWKNVEPIFGPVSLQDMSYFSQQGDLGHKENLEYEGSGFGELNRRTQNQVEVKESARSVEFTDQFQEFDNFCGKLDSERIINKVAPLCQRVLSALILDEEVEELEESCMERNASGQYTNDFSCDFEPEEWDSMECEYGSAFGAFPGNRIFPCNGTNNPNRSSIGLNHSQNGYLHSEVGAFVGHFGNTMGETQVVQRNGFTISSFDNQYENMDMEDKLLLELHSVGIHLEAVPDLDDGEDESLSQEIIQLKQGLQNQVGRKKTSLEKLYQSVQQGKEAEARKLEAVAMDKLVESANRKLLATRGSIASKYGIAKVSKQVALSFSKRTIARCKAFEESGTSCFNEPALRDAMFAVSTLGSEGEAATGDDVRLGSKLNITDRHNRGPLDTLENYASQSDEAFAKNGPISNRGRKKEVMLDDVGGGTALRLNSAHASTPLGGEVKRKRSDRDREGNVPKVGRPSLGNLKGERKSKAKPKQKSAQLSTPGNGNKLADTKHQKRDMGMVSPGTVPTQGSSKENQEEEEEEALDFSALPLPDLDTLDVLGGNDGLGGNQDLNSLLNFDDVGLLDHDSAGLEIPMDDLSELNMF